MDQPRTAGWGNDYTWIEAALRLREANGEPLHFPCSIVIPVYNRREMLARTLAALMHQTYPLDRIEVIVADDGSTDDVQSVIRKYETRLDLVYVRQRDRGYRLAAVRNLGIRASRHPYVILLDCDVLPTVDLVQSYLKYFHASDRCVLLGTRRFVDASAITDDIILDDRCAIDRLPEIVTAYAGFAKHVNNGATYDWRQNIYEQTDRLKHSPIPFRCVVGATFAFPRIAFDLVGGFSEEFQHWGREDAEFGYRLETAGYWFIPVDGAVGLHQEPEHDSQVSDRQGGVQINQALMEEKCPNRHYRKSQAGRIYQVPKVSVVLGPDSKVSMVDILAQSFTDWECVVGAGSNQDAISMQDARVRFAPTSALPEMIDQCRGMFIAFTPGGGPLPPTLLDRLVLQLEESPDAAGALAGGMVALIRRRDWSRASFGNCNRVAGVDALVQTLARHGRIITIEPLDTKQEHP